MFLIITISSVLYIYIYVVVVHIYSRSTDWRAC